MALKGGQYLAGSVFLIGKGTFNFVVGFGVMLYLLFFLLKDGPYLVNLALEALPLSQHVKHHLFVKFAAVSRATVKGTVVVAVVQGALGGLAFYFTGIDGSLLWGALMAFLSIIPAVGSAIIWVPAVIYFFATGMLWKAIFLVVFFVVVIGLVDNILRPLLVGKDTKMPDYLILISTLGGMEIYGINGFVIGPLIAALFIACWNILSGRDSEENIEEIDEEFIEEGKTIPTRRSNPPAANHAGAQLGPFLSVVSLPRWKNGFRYAYFYATLAIAFTLLCLMAFSIALISCRSTATSNFGLAFRAALRAAGLLCRLWLRQHLAATAGGRCPALLARRDKNTCSDRRHRDCQSGRWQQTRRSTAAAASAGWSDWWR